MPPILNRKKQYKSELKKKKKMEKRKDFEARRSYRTQMGNKKEMLMKRAALQDSFGIVWEESAHSRNKETPE